MIDNIINIFIGILLKITDQKNVSHQSLGQFLRSFHHHLVHGHPKKQQVQIGTQGNAGDLQVFCFGRLIFCAGKMLDKIRFTRKARAQNDNFTGVFTLYM